MDINKVYSGDTFKADDLGDEEPTLTISSVEAKQFDNGNKLIIGFDGQKKKLVCNKTNAKRIGHMFGNDTDQWIGHPITLYTEHVDFQGNIVPAIRVKIVKPRPSAPNRPPVRPASADMNRNPPRRQTGGMSEDYREEDDSIPF